MSRCNKGAAAKKGAGYWRTGICVLEFRVWKSIWHDLFILFLWFLCDLINFGIQKIWGTKWTKTKYWHEEVARRRTPPKSRPLPSGLEKYVEADWAVKRLDIFLNPKKLQYIYPSLIYSWFMLFFWPDLSVDSWINNLIDVWFIFIFISNSPILFKKMPKGPSKGRNSRPEWCSEKTSRHFQTKGRPAPEIARRELFG